jgi:ABC-2 type transport system permease protein
MNTAGSTTTTTQPPQDTASETSPAKRAGSLFVAVSRSEWTKLRSVRSTVWSLFATFAITVGFGALLTSAYIHRYDKLALKEHLAFDPIARSLRGRFLAQLAIGALGVLVITAEYSTGLIRTTFATVPQRRVVLAAKAAVFCVTALVVSMISAFTAFFVGQGILNQKHLGVSIGDPQVLRAVLGAGTYLTLIALLGLGLGTILRRTAGAITSLFALALALPLLAQSLPSPWDTDVSKYLPSELGNALVKTRPDTTLLSPGTALIVAVAWLTATFTIATILLTRRDT